MIIYQMKKPIKCYDTDCVGVTGDNIAYTQYFYIKGVSDNSISYTLHLRFADGSVNSITPDNVVPDGEGTEIRWIVKKNDIFLHGYFELQIEGRNKFGLVFQTEIVRLYADESLPVEDREYENPNSETIRLRDEAYSVLEEIKKQQAQIEQNVEKIKQTDLNNKADKSTTLAGYGITDAYTKTEVDNALSGKLDNTVGSVKTDNIANKAVTSDKIANGAITALKLANNAVSGSNIAQNQIGTNHLQSGAVTTDKLADVVKTIINSKYDSSNVETGSGELTVNTSNAEKIKSASFDYQKIGSFVQLNVYIAFNSFTPESLKSSITFSGLPFVCKNQVTPREMCVTSQKKQLVWGIASNTSALTVLYMSMDEFVDGEKLSFSICYKIS